MSKARITARSFFDVAFKTIIMLCAFSIIPLLFFPGKVRNFDRIFAIIKTHFAQQQLLLLLLLFALAEKENQLSFLCVLFIGQHKSSSFEFFY